MKPVIMIFVVALHLCMITSSSSVTRTRHKRAWIIDSFTIEEEKPGPYELGKVHVNRDYRVKFKLSGNGVDKDPKDVLEINETTGVIKVLKKVNYEDYQVLKLKFEARNVSNEKVDTRLGVEITILDINDQTPTFSKEVYDVSIEESQKQGTRIFTAYAVDKDKPGTLNSSVEYKIISVTPKIPTTEFYIEENGKISFKGCLDYEKAKRFTILVEAKDRGTAVRRSSTSTVIVNVQDQNNYMPVFSGRTGDGRVIERESGMSPLRIHVTDKDTNGTTAWRVKYTIHGDREGNFKIQTDPETNDGILTVVKPLDFEQGSERVLSISMENEEPYFSCQLKRKTSSGLWKVNNIDADPAKGGVLVFVSQNFSVIVDDVNDPPVFTFTKREVAVDENSAIGHFLETFTATDPDGKSPNDFEYVKGDDPGDWVSVNPKTGEITTANTLDRESHHVNNSIYVITIYAVDKGDPPMTATATLTLHVTDKNDNLPQLDSNILSVCLSEETTMTNISAYDLDGDPYGGPFRFELLGDDKEKWSLDPNYGTVVNLIKKPAVYAGHHQLQMKIYDKQEHFSEQNISVTVCDCSVRPDCLGRAASSSSKINSSGIGILFAALFLLLGILLLGFLLVCGREKIEFPLALDSADVLLTSNIETPGTDCKIPDTPQPIKVDQRLKETDSKGVYGQNIAIHSNHQTAINNQQVGSQRLSSYRDSYQNKETLGYHQHYNNTIYKNMSLQQSMSRTDRYKASTLPPTSGHHTATSWGGSFRMRREALSSLVSKRLFSVQAVEEEQYDYDPKVYTCEEDLVLNPELDCISIDEGSFEPDDLLYLGPRFQNLAKICSPTPTQL